MELFCCAQGANPVDFFYASVRSLPENLPCQLNARYLQRGELLGEAGKLEQCHWPIRNFANDISFAKLQ